MRWHVEGIHMRLYELRLGDTQEVALTPPGSRPGRPRGRRTEGSSSSPAISSRAVRTARSTRWTSRVGASSSSPTRRSRSTTRRPRTRRMEPRSSSSRTDGIPPRTGTISSRCAPTAATSRRSSFARRPKACSSNGPAGAPPPFGRRARRERCATPPRHRRVAGRARRAPSAGSRTCGSAHPLARVDATIDVRPGHPSIGAQALTQIGGYRAS
jgi:hypothetical protein